MSSINEFPATRPHPPGPKASQEVVPVFVATCDASHSAPNETREAAAAGSRLRALTAPAAYHRISAPAQTSRDLGLQSPAFAVRVAVNQQAIIADANEFRLLPSMAVAVEINTGQRRTVDFVSAQVKAASLHERGSSKRAHAARTYQRGSLGVLWE